MSRAEVRNATAAWFDPAAPNNSGIGFGLHTVHRSMPKEVTESELMSSAYLDRSGAIAFVAVERQTEGRIAFNGPHGGLKRTAYSVLIRLRHMSVATDAELAMDDFDLLVDAISARLRADRTLGNPVIFEAGEDQVLDWTFGMPTTNDAGATIMWGELRFLAIQMIVS